MDVLPILKPPPAGDHAILARRKGARNGLAPMEPTPQTRPPFLYPKIILTPFDTTSPSVSSTPAQTNAETKFAI
jgi:hypothetical protein